MLLKGLPRAQHFLPAWSARNLGVVRHWASQSSGVESSGESAPAAAQTPSLYDELFPEESQKEKSSATATGDLRSSEPHMELRVRRLESMPFGASTRRALARESQYPRLQDASVLVLSNVSKSLALSDFLRLSPKGKHIDGWASGIIKVIPGRDANTLEAQGHYFILFSTDAAACRYQSKLIRLHSIARSHTATSIASSLPPPPGYLQDGEETHALIQSFTLVPPSLPKVSVRLLQKPFHPAVHRMIAAGGYPAIVKLDAASRGLVLLSLDRARVSLYELTVALGKDGRERNLPWSLSFERDDIIRLDGGKAVLDEGDLGPGSAAPRDLEAKSRKRLQTSRFILSFANEKEARRFVSAWHRRPFPSMVRPQDPGDEEPPLVSAELLW